MATSRGGSYGRPDLNMVNRGGYSGRAIPDDPFRPQQAFDPNRPKAISDSGLGGSNDPWDGGGRPNMFWSEDYPELDWNIDWSQISGIPSLDMFSDDISAVESATMDRMSALLDPKFAQRETDMNEMLANRGNPMGSAVNSISRNQFGRDYGQAYERAAQGSVLAGRQEHSRLFDLAMGSHRQGLSDQINQIGLNNQARGQAFGEQMDVRGQLFQELMGQLGTSQFDPNASLTETGFDPSNFMQALMGGGTGGSTGWTDFMTGIGGVDWESIFGGGGNTGATTTPAM